MGRASADEGLTLAQIHRPHAIILDLRMPLTSGLQFLRPFARSPAWPIPRSPSSPATITSTTRSSTNSRRSARELRFKPLWLDELVTLARELLTAPGRD